MSLELKEHFGAVNRKLILFKLISRLNRSHTVICEGYRES